MTIGFIGLGIMGESMCANIVKKHNDTVYCSDMVKAKVEELATLGAVACADNVELAEKADVIISMVPKSEHSKAVYTQILPKLGKNKICIDMSTIDPSVSVEISNSMDKISSEITEITNSVSAVNEMSGNNKDSIGKVTNEINKFKI